MTHLRFAALIAAAGLLLCRQAAADPSDADRATARALAAQAHKAFDEKDYTTAADRFSRADSLVHAPTLLLGLARAQAGLGKLVAAQETYSRIVREGAPASAPKVFVDAVDDARKELAALAPRVSWVTLNLTGAPDAKVLIDGVAIPSAAIGVPRAVDPGKHVAAASVEGGVPVEVTVTVAEGKTETVTLAVKPAGAGPVAPVPLPVPPPAPTPARAVPLPAPAPAPAPAAAPPRVPEATGSTRKTVALVSLGVGGAGLALGAVTGGLVFGMHGGLATSCPRGDCPASQKSQLGTYNALGLVSTIGFIAGGAGAALGVVLLATSPKKPGASVGLMVGPTAGGGALGAAGSF